MKWIGRSVWSMVCFCVSRVLCVLKPSNKVMMVSDKMEDYKRKWKDMKERVDRITSFLLHEIDNVRFEVETWDSLEGMDIKVPIRGSDETLVFAVHVEGGTFIELEEAEGDA